MAHPARSAMPQVTVECSPEVAQARDEGRPIVALESTIIAQGLPRPENFEYALEFEDIVRDEGAVPATIAVLDGVARVGLTREEVHRISMDEDVRKLGLRDLPLALAKGVSGATTVSGTAFLAARQGIRVFATGGIGGVHRQWVDTWDESADLGVLATERLTLVCAGVKSILDVPATVQRLETLNVAVVGYQTDELPGFYLRSAGLPLDWRVERPDEIATAMRQQDALDIRSALLVTNPVAELDQLDPEQHAVVLAESLRAANEAGVEGQQITPFLLDYLVRATHGESLRANLAAVRGNIRLAAQIAVSFAEQSTPAADPAFAMTGAPT